MSNSPGFLGADGATTRPRAVTSDPCRGVSRGLSPPHPTAKPPCPRPRSGSPAPARPRLARFVPARSAPLLPTPRPDGSKRRPGVLLLPFQPHPVADSPHSDKNNAPVHHRHVPAHAPATIKTTPQDTATSHHPSAASTAAMTNRRQNIGRRSSQRRTRFRITSRQPPCVQFVPRVGRVPGAGNCPITC